MTYTSNAYAKINISLDITGKLPDGYHEMKMVMQTVSLSDEITIKCESGRGISVSAGLPYIPDDERNIAVKAANTFFDYTQISGYKTQISIKKNIPVCAGLGGGSADAACVLRMLNKIFDTGLDRKVLEALGETIGSDVPFCIDGGTKLAEGRGEILTDLTPIKQSFVVICKPAFSCSTPELFALVKCKEIRSRPDTSGLIKALDEHDLSGIARRMYNVFEDILPYGMKKDVDEIKGVMIEFGALGATMTGSGSTVFGLFDNEAAAQNAFGKLKEDYEECFLAETVGRLQIHKYCTND